jgi:proteasome lid subunit RPN8/RPN11
MLTPTDLLPLKRKLLDICINNQPNESCGFLVKQSSNLIVYPCLNVHPDPLNHFEISANSYAEASNQGEIAAIYHSHTYSSEQNGKVGFSQVDQAACEASGLPWVLLVLPQEELKTLYPTGYTLPYIDRPFVYGLLDCYALVRDVYKQDLNILLNDYPRGEEGEWNDKADWNFFVDNFAKEGFVECDRRAPLKKYDILLMQIGSAKLNHAAIVWEPERNIILHHLAGRFSGYTVFGGSSYRIGKKLRHKSKFTLISSSRLEYAK